MILLDTSGLLAALDDSERDHAHAARALASRQPRILSPFVLAELDYLLASRVGQDAELKLLAEVWRGAYRLETFDSEDVRVAHGIMERFSGLQLGLADASIVVLAHRFDCLDVLTLDERHFRVVTGPRGEAFRILPGDFN